MKNKSKIKSLLGIAALAASGYGSFKLVQYFRKINHHYQEFIYFNNKDEKEEEFTGGSYGLVCSNMCLDLSEAVLSGELVTIDLYGAMSNIEITLPENCKVELSGKNNGSIIDNTYAENHDEEQDAEQCLVHINYDLRYSCFRVLGGSEEV